MQIIVQIIVCSIVHPIMCGIYHGDFIVQIIVRSFDYALFYVDFIIQIRYDFALYHTLYCLLY